MDNFPNGFKAKGGKTNLDNSNRNQEKKTKINLVIIKHITRQKN